MKRVNLRVLVQLIGRRPMKECFGAAKRVHSILTIALTN